MANVALLHCDGTQGSTTITDEIGKTWTVAGNAAIDTAQRRIGTGSIIFDGTGDWVTTPNSTDFDFGTGNWTVEFWMRRNGTVAYSGLISTVTVTATGWGIDLNSAGTGIRVIVNNTEIIAGGTIADLTWTHIAIVRNSNVLTAYINGISVDTYDCTAVTFNDDNAGVILGALTVDTPTYPFTGWLDEIIINKGTAVYTANFTPPILKGSFLPFL